VKTLIIGLTGQTGAGKSTVAAMLSEKGFYIIDGDMVAREITAAGAPVLEKLVTEFGADIINADGTLNRILLGSRAFATREMTQRLNSITHPVITVKMLEILKEAEKRGEKAVVIDAAALLESGIAKMCDIVAAVTAPEKTRLNRIMNRDGLGREETLKRMHAQLGEKYYKEHADIVLCTYPPSQVKKEVERLLSLISETAKS
jgi:dephospho-CoA kinase